MSQVHGCPECGQAIFCVKCGTVIDGNRDRIQVRIVRIDDDAIRAYSYCSTTCMTDHAPLRGVEMQTAMQN